MRKFFMIFALLACAGGGALKAQNGSSVAYLASHVSYAPIDENGNMGDIVFVINKDDKSKIQIYLIKEKECSAFYIGKVEKPESGS